MSSIIDNVTEIGARLEELEGEPSARPNIKEIFIMPFSGRIEHKTTGEVRDVNRGFFIDLDNWRVIAYNDPNYRIEDVRWRKYHSIYFWEI